MYGRVKKGLFFLKLYNRNNKMLINEYIPEFHFSEKHTIKVNATKDQILKTIIDLAPNEISFLFNLLFFIRSLPPRILGRDYIGFRPDTPLLSQLEKKGFKILETTDQEIVFGIIGQFGRIKRKRINSEVDFKNFNESESGKVVTNFFLAERKDNVLVSTETRIYMSDKKAKRKFAIYWMIVYPGSALIRRIWLKAIKKRSEKYKILQ